MNTQKYFNILIFIFLFQVWSSFASDQITQIRSFSQILNNDYSENDCLAFDLDDTVWIPIEKIMRNINFDDRKRFLDEIRNLAGNERISYIYDNVPYRLVENIFLEFINNLERSNIPTVAFTARRTGKATLDQKTMVEDDTLEILRNLNLNFNARHFQNLELHNVSPNNEEFKDKIVDSRLKPFELSNNAMVKNSVIFTNNIDKGFVLGEIFSKGGFFPTKFILVDDKLPNLTSVQEAINNINRKFNVSIKFEGFLYTGYLELDNNIDPKIVEVQKNYFLQNPPIYVSEDNARKLLEEIKTIQ
jgi:hypothetical protein